MTPHVTLRGLGPRLTVSAPPSAFLRQDSLWRLAHHYGPALTARSLAPAGLAVDIGAGFGAFALPFAQAYPGWRVLAFEPDADCFAHLRANAPDRVVALNCAVLGGTEALPADPAATRAALSEVLAGADPARLLALLPRLTFSRKQGYAQPGPAPDPGFETVDYPVLAAGLLTGLAPNLLKLLAPQAEGEILYDLSTVALDHILGESWSHVRWRRACHPTLPGRRETWLPIAGPGLLALRQTPGLSPLRPGLDVVVALYNAQDHIADCIRGILRGADSDIRVIVVDDGSTDDSVARVTQAFGKEPRVRVVSKPNGGCASARNYGRLMSDASHIAFVDADDIPGPQMFAGLLELARQTGAEMVQSGFHFVEETEEGLTTTPSRESGAEILARARRHAFGDKTCLLLPSRFLAKGQPSIWRRVYRRDFLDTRRIWFPEHIRAYDDQIFQLATLHQVVNVPVLEGVSYGYRQHPGQDTRQRDERNIYSLEMFRMGLKRGLAEGWPEFHSFLRSFINTVDWISEGLRPDLLPGFLRGAAELWVIAGKVLPPGALEDMGGHSFRHPEMPGLVQRLESALADLPASAAYVHLDAVEWQVPLVRNPWERV